MRIFTLAVLAASLGAAPAFAQATCRISNTVDGKQSSVSGEVADTTLSMLVTENGPFPAKLTIDTGSLYAAAPALAIYRIGNSVTGRDWREPGSVETLDGGLLVSWPGFTLRGARVRNLTYGFSSGLTKTRQTISYPAPHTGAEAIFLRLDGRMATPANARLHETTYSELNQWRNVVINRTSVRVDVFDEDAGVHIATIDFTLPVAPSTQARIVSDVNALRRAVAQKSCG